MAYNIKIFPPLYSQMIFCFIFYNLYIQGTLLIKCFDYTIWFQYRYTDFPPPSSPSLTYSPLNEYITSFQLLTEYVLRTHMKFLWLSRLSRLSTYGTCKKCHLWVPRFLEVQRNISRMCFYNLVAFFPPQIKITESCEEKICMKNGSYTSNNVDRQY